VLGVGTGQKIGGVDGSLVWTARLPGTLHIWAKKSTSGIVSAVPVIFAVSINQSKQGLKSPIFN
jgi:hypothetical protein